MRAIAITTAAMRLRFIVALQDVARAGSPPPGREGGILICGYTVTCRQLIGPGQPGVAYARRFSIMFR